MSADEELARRLDQQLNKAPAAGTGKRRRRVPDFYVPLVSGSKGQRQMMASTHVKDDSDTSSRDNSWKAEGKDSEDDAGFKPQSGVERNKDAAMGSSGKDGIRSAAARQSESVGRSQDDERSQRDRKSKGLRELQALINDVGKTAAHKVGHRPQRSGRIGVVEQNTNKGEESESSPSSSHSHSGDCQCSSDGQEQRLVTSKEALGKQSQPAGTAPLPRPVGEQQRQTRALRRQSQNGASTECPSSGIQQRSCASGGQHMDAKKQIQQHGAVDAHPRKRQRLDDLSGGDREPTHCRNISACQAGDRRGNVENLGRTPTNRQEKQKLPRMPMVLHNKEWYRARILSDEEDRIFVEFTGFEDGSFVKPFWLAKDSELIWRGSYRGKDWKYLGDGAWQPRVPDGKKKTTRRGRCPHGRRRLGEDESDYDMDPNQNGYTEERQQCMPSVSQRLRSIGREHYTSGSESAPVLSQTSGNEDRSQSRVMGGAMRCETTVDVSSPACGGHSPGVGTGAAVEAVADSAHQEAHRDLRREKENQAVEDCDRECHAQSKQHAQEARRQGDEEAKGHGCTQTAAASDQSLLKVTHPRCDVDADARERGPQHTAPEVEARVDIPASEMVASKVARAKDVDMCGTVPGAVHGSDFPTRDERDAVTPGVKVHDKVVGDLRDPGRSQEARSEGPSGDGAADGECLEGPVPVLGWPLQQPHGKEDGVQPSDCEGSRESDQGDSNEHNDRCLSRAREGNRESGDEGGERSGMEKDRGGVVEVGMETAASSATHKTGFDESPTKTEAAHGDARDGDEATWEHVRRSERVKRLGWKGAWKHSCKSGSRSGNDDEPGPSARVLQPASPVGPQQGQQLRTRASKRIAAQAAANDASKKTGGDPKTLVRSKSGPLRRATAEGELCKSPREQGGATDPFRQRTKSHRLKSHRSLPVLSTQNRGYTSVVGRSMTHALAMTSEALHWTANNAIQRHIRRHLPYYTGHISDERLGAFVELMECLDGPVRPCDGGTPRSTPSHSQSGSLAAAPPRDQDPSLPPVVSPVGGNVKGGAGRRQPGQTPVPLPWATAKTMVSPVVQFPTAVPGMEPRHKPQGRAPAVQPGAQASQAQGHAMPVPHPPVRVCYH